MHIFVVHQFKNYLILIQNDQNCSKLIFFKLNYPKLDITSTQFVADVGGAAGFMLGISVEWDLNKVSLLIFLKIYLRKKIV
jgi:hypothetical protein